MEEDNDIKKLDISRIENAVATRRHNDTMSILKQLITAFNQPKQSIDLQPFINQNKELINGFISKLNELAKPQAVQAAPIVNVNQEKVISSLTEMTKTINQSMKSLEDAVNNFNDKKAISYEVTITERNYGGFAQKITIKPKL